MRRPPTLGLFGLVALLANISGLLVEAQSCSSANPCSVGCCSKWGFCGVGPDFCADDVCVDTCDFKADCDPGGFGEQYVKSVTCPLNVCCSKFGFCGMTKDFCGTKTVKRPSYEVNENTGFPRIIGYYEGWAPNRACNAILPEHIPMGIYTHLNFAFASINPTTYQIVPASSYDPEMYLRLTKLKKRDPDLKIFIAIGGWTFNDEGPTMRTFSDIARSETNQKAFFNSLASFMSTYGFDGVDIDWEYPGAKDRFGRPEDFQNLPKFLKNLKDALRKIGRPGLSITLPASYWYLQHFDVKKVTAEVDWINMMTYDFHGVWDKKEEPNEWVQPLLNSHTNLTEIKEAMDLLWRNGINEDKVTLGMAFYGRGFTATSPSCMAKGCTFESGTGAGPCSGEVSVLLNSEIDDLVASKGLTPTLDEEAGVKILTWDGNQWLTYDDVDTFRLKANFARSQGMGGVMVWAVSHDTRDAKYSWALASVAQTKYKSLQMKMVGDSDGTTGDGYEYKVNYKAHCKWTGCREICPNNWIRMMRSGPGARSNEYMTDDTGCDGYGTHQLCCPPNQEIPTCGWYTHHNGECDNECPSGMKEIGSHSKHCHQRGAMYGPNYKSYQAACCTVDKDNMKLYSQCDWGQPWPACFNKAGGGAANSCSNTQVSFSLDGSGAAQCMYKYGTRDYCCDNDDSNSHWKDCAWHKGISQGLTGQPSDFCYANCPADTVRVAMSSSGCAGASSWAHCCTPEIKTITKRYDEETDEYDMYLDMWADEPFCDKEGFAKLKAKRSDTGSMLAGTSALAARAESKLDIQDTVYSLIDSLFFLYKATTALINVWDAHIPAGPGLSSSTYSNVSTWLAEEGEWIKDTGGITGPLYMLCNIHYINDAIAAWWAKKKGGSATRLLDCTCATDSCCAEDDDACINFDPQTNDPGLVTRGISINLFEATPLIADAAVSPLDMPETVYRVHINASSLARVANRKRAGQEPYPATAIDENTGAVTVFDWVSLGYPGPSQLRPTVHAAIYASSWRFDPNCPQMRPRRFNSIVPNQNAPSNLGQAQVDHPIERQMVPNWSRDAYHGVLASGSDDDPFEIDGVRFSVPLRFFTHTIQYDIRIRQPNAPRPRGGADLWVHSRRIMSALGTSFNNDVMSLLPSLMNQLKAIMWTRGSFWTLGNILNIIVGATNPQLLVGPLIQARNVIVTFRWHNEPNINTNMRTAITEMRQEIRYAEIDHMLQWQEEAWALDHFDAWFQDHFARMRQNVIDQVTELLDNIEEEAPVAAGDPQVVSFIASLRANIAQANFAIAYDNTWWPPLP
ncbi:family 18 glycosyl hydrolase [Rhypophila decipiens]